MKKTKLFLASALMLTVFSVSATRSTETIKSSAEEKWTECKSCGVSDAQIASYVRALGHTVYSVVDIPGTCNSTANIENCQSMVVYVQAGIIIGHSDAAGICGGL